MGMYLHHAKAGQTYISIGCSCTQQRLHRISAVLSTYFSYGFISGGSNSPSFILTMNKRLAQSFTVSSETMPCMNHIGPLVHDYY